MKRLSLVFISAIFSCTISQTETPLVPDPQPENEVRALLDSPLQDTPGSLKLVDSYQPDESGIHFKNLHFYNSQNQLVLTVSKYIGGHRTGDWLFAPGDTVAASIFSYEGDRLAKKKDFDFKNSTFTYASEVNYTYDEQGRLFQLKNGFNEALITHFYNELGQLQYKRYGKNQDREFDEFQYDESGRVSVHFYWGGGDVPIFVRNYRYNDEGLLEAKIERLPGGGWDDKYIFTYNDQGLLLREEEFDLSFGKSLFSTKAYTYTQQ